MALIPSGGIGLGYGTLVRSGLRQRIVPDNANGFYVVARNDRGTAFAHRFTRNSGGSEATDTGAPWANWRYVGTAEIPTFDAAPTHAARFVYSEDVGAQDYAFQSSANGKFMGSYHGGAVLSSEAVRIDGVPVDPLIAATGTRVTVEHSVTLTSGAANLTLTCEIAIDPGDGGLSFAMPATASAAAFAPAFWGMGIASGDTYDQCDLVLSGGTSEFSLPVGTGTTYLGAARRIRLRDSVTGRAIRIDTNAATQPAFRRASVLRTPARTKWYLEGLTGMNASKANIVWRVRFEAGSGPATTPGANLLTNGGFSADLSGWNTVMSGGSVGWNAGKLRATRGSGSDNRITQAAAVLPGAAYLLSGEHQTSAGAAPSLALTNNAASYQTPAAAYPPTPFAGDGYTAHVVVPTAASSWVMLLQSVGTAGQTSDFDNISLVKLADAI
ncbi:hypothetical protein [Sphingomonas sp. ID0503]|uniref:hypothetical protein n=1 Tax=Sphingomonas sp. ID0503 TaxID=3399691 RepID=UPI003AFA0454